MRAALALLAALALAGCGSDSDPGPGEVTVGDARALNEAAAATDINAVVIDEAPDNSAE